MTEQIAVFRSRAQAIDCNLKLRSMGVQSTLINTPREANIGCGLSVKIPPASVERAKLIIKNSKYTAFYGFFKISRIIN